MFWPISVWSTWHWCKPSECLILLYDSYSDSLSPQLQPLRLWWLSNNFPLLYRNYYWYPNAGKGAKLDYCLSVYCITVTETYVCVLLWTLTLENIIYVSFLSVVHETQTRIMQFITLFWLLQAKVGAPKSDSVTPGVEATEKTQP